MDLGVFTAEEPAVYSVVKLVPDNDVLWAVGMGNPACGGKCVRPHICECHDFDDHVGGEDTERQDPMYGADTVFECAHGPLGVAYVFILH